MWDTLSSEVGGEENNDCAKDGKNACKPTGVDLGDWFVAHYQVVKTPGKYRTTAEGEQGVVTEYSGPLQVVVAELRTKGQMRQVITGKKELQQAGKHKQPECQ